MVLSGRAKDAYFTLVGVSYLFAFWSLHQQWAGLFSENGLLPADVYTERHAKSDFALGLLSRLPIDCLSAYSLIMGCLLSVAIVAGYHSSVLFAIVWVLYLLLFSIGQTFLSFQWDTLLLETGFITIFAAPYVLLPRLAFDERDTRVKAPYIWCLRFLAFKLMFLSGVVKLQSNCPTWRDLTALSYHFQTQCLPTPVSWYFSQLPPVVLHAFVAATLLIEIPLSCLLVFPLDYARRVAAVLNIIFQLAIMITGNYNFFNVLTIALMVACWESDSMTARLNVSEGLRALQQIVVFALVVGSSVLMLDIPAFTAPQQAQLLEWWSGKHLSLRADLYSKHLQPLLLPAVATCLVTALLCAALSSLYALTQQAKRVSMGSVAKVVNCAIALTWILVCSTAFHPLVDMRRLAPRAVLELAETRLARWHITSSYGLFRHMTGVGRASAAMQAQGVVQVARPEVVVEALLPGESGRWVELPFRAKPGSETAWPRFLVPALEHPRLDWQMWFLALGDYASNPWFIHLVYKLLQPPGGRLFSPEVARLLDTTALASLALLRNDSRPIKAVRAKLYEYDMTYWRTPWNALRGGAGAEEALLPKRFWQRTFVREFLPVVDLDNESLKAFLESHKLRPSRKYASVQARHRDCMRSARYDRFFSKQSPARGLLCGGILLQGGGQLVNMLLALFFLVLFANHYVQSCVESSRREQESKEKQD